MTTAVEGCAACAALAAAGVTTVDRDVCPGGEELLEVFGPGEGHHSTWQLRRCRDCGTIYRYSYHSEYDVTGSWDEYSLWRLEDPAQGPLQALLALPPGDARDPALAAVLRAPSDQAREAGALLAWIWVCEGQALDASVTAAAAALGDPTFMVGNFAYRTLLTYLRRGHAEATRTLADLAAEAASEPRFSPILGRECRLVLAAAP